MFSDRATIYNSPRAVFDMESFEADQDKLLRNLDSLRTPLSLPPSLRHASVLTMEAADGSSSQEDDLPPALRCLSVGTRSLDDNDEDDDKDDASTVSSVSLEDFQESAAPAKRCIFASYWDKKGGRPKGSLLSTCEEDQPLSPTSMSSSSDEADSEERTAKALEQSYEDLLDESAASATEMPTRRSSAPSAGPRRRLFDNQTVSQYSYQSEPSLLLQTRVEPLRKTQSERAVGSKPPSCLRPCRFSGSSRRTSTSSAASTSSAVSFSEHVQIKHYKNDTEKFAAKGWSKYFM